MAAGLRRLEDWRAFLLVLATVPPSTQPKLPFHSGHDSVAILLSDTPLGRSASPPWHAASSAAYGALLL